MSVTTLLAPLKPGVPLGVDCRVVERYPCNLPSACQPIAAREDRDLLWPGTIRDISTRGLGLVLARRFERGAGLAVEVSHPGADSKDTLLARVVHATALPEGRWLLGCAFVSEISPDELNALLRLGPARQPAPVAVSDTNIVVPGLTFEGTAGTGRVAHIPVRRLFLKGVWPPPPGTLLKVKVANQSSHLPGVLIRVNRCVFEEGRWTLNYSFAERPAADMMGVFGYTPSLMDF